MLCPHCSAQTLPTHNFCGKCGSNLTSKASPPPETRTSPDAPDTAARTNPPSNRFQRAREILAKIQRTLAPAHPEDTASSIPLPLEIALLSALAAIALLLRVNNLSDIPPGIHGDEANYALEVIRILQQGWIGIWTGVNLGAGTAPLYYAAPFFIFGGQTIEMLRLSVALLGAAMVPIAHILVRHLFGARIAITTAAMLTFSFWFLVQSRLGWDPIHSVSMYLLSMSLLFTGVRSNRLKPAWRICVVALAGIAFGLGLYTNKIYLIYYLFTVAAIVGITIVGTIPSIVSRIISRIIPAMSAAISPTIIPAMEDPRSQFPKIRDLLWFIAPSLIVGAPMLLNYLLVLNVFDIASNDFGADLSLSLSSQIQRLNRAWDVLMFIHNPIDDGLDGAGKIPLISPLLIRLVFWIGIATTLLLINKRPYQLLLIGWLIAMLPTILVPGGESRRYLLGIFFLMVILSIGINAIVHNSIKHLYAQYSNTLVNSVSAILIAGFIAIFALYNHLDFNNYATSAIAKWYMSHDLVQACREIQPVDDELDRDYQLRLYSNRWSHSYSIIRLLLPNAKGVDGSVEFGGDGTATSAGELKGDAIFLLLHKYSQDKLAAEIEAEYPGGRWLNKPDQNPKSLFSAYIVSAP